MSNTSTGILDQQVKSFMKTMGNIQSESADLLKLYNAEVTTDAAYTGLAAGAPATKTTKLTKQEAENCKDINVELNNFFTNGVLTQSDYWLDIQGILNGNDEITVSLSVAIESFATRNVNFLVTVLQLFKNSKNILDQYFDTEISDAVAAVSSEELPWEIYSKSDLTDAITLIEQFKKLLNNEVAAQGDYGSTVAKWQKII